MVGFVVCIVGKKVSGGRRCGWGGSVLCRRRAGRPWPKLDSPLWEIIHPPRTLLSSSSSSSTSSSSDPGRMRMDVTGGSTAGEHPTFFYWDGCPTFIQCPRCQSVFALESEEIGGQSLENNPSTRPTPTNRKNKDTQNPVKQQSIHTSNLQR